jgi:hypothetical protein
MWRAIILLSVSRGVAFGNWNDTSTGIDLDKLPHFHLTKIRSGWLKEGESVTFDGISAAASGAGVRLSGAAKAGKCWEIRIFGIDEVWRGDLDGNGTQDYVFFAGGPYGNGRIAPSYSLSILLMDPEGLPVPFFTVVYKGENGDGIKHLVDLYHDGKAELLISDYDESPSDPYVEFSCSGHWISQLYHVKNLGAEEIRGTVRGIHFPFIHNWSYRGTECPDVERPYLKVTRPAPSNYQTAGPGLATALRSPGDQNGFVAIEPVGGCRTIGANALLYDTPRIRRIAFPNQFDDYSESLLNRIWMDRAHVELRGVTKSDGGECSVKLLWAK